MRKSVPLVVVLILALSRSQAQSTPSDGHYLKWVQDNIRVYQSKSGKPVTDRFKYWEFKYWFYADEIVDGDKDIKYIKIFIPEGNKKLGVKEADDWATDSVKYINEGDFNSWLFLKKDDYDKLQKEHFPKRTLSFITSAITVPFKIHPALDGHASSLYNSSVNGGLFLGVRLGYFNDFLGFNIGAMFSVQSLNQTASVNTAITDNTSESMFASSYGPSFVIDLGRKFQIGYVLGFDHGYGDKSKTYIYHDRAWHAFSLNFNFLDLGKKDTSQ